MLNDAWQIAARHHAKGVLLAAAGSTVQAAPAAVNLISNAGFTDLTGWSLRNYGVEDAGKLRMEISPEGRNGGTALMIRAEARADAGAGIEVDVKPNQRYRVGGWVRTENLELKGGRGAMINVHGLDAVTTAIKGSTGWTELSAEFDSGNEARVLVHCLFGGYGGAVGTAYWDDVYLQEVGGGNTGAMLAGIATHFAANGTAVDKKEVSDVLAKRADDFSKDLLARIGAAPAEVKPMVRKHAPDASVHARGMAVYNRTCIACHGPEGKGVPLAFPSLDGSARLGGDPSIPIRIVLHGFQGPIESGGQKFNNIMAPLGDLKDEEIADVLSYVRQSWGNDAAPVTADAVKTERAKHAARKTSWTADELK